MQKKGQSSTEYLMTMGFVLVLMIPVTVLAYTSFSDYKDTIQSRQVLVALSTIAEHARSVYNTGPPSFSTIQIYFPSSVSGVYIAGTTITARVTTSQGPDDITMFSSVPLNGSISSIEGTRNILITATDTGVVISES